MKFRFDAASIRKTFYLGLGLLGLAATSAQSGTLNGVVRKLTDSTLVSGAKIVLLTGATRTDSLVTDSAGGYSFLNVATGNDKQLIVSRAGFATVTSATLFVFQATTTVTTNFYLGAPATLSGTVRRSTDSTVLAGAWVYLRRSSTASAILDSVQTGAQGTYAFSNLAPGTPNYYVTATLSPYVTSSNSNLTLGSGATVVSNLYLAPVLPGSISGKVFKGSDSTALAGAKLLLRRGSSDTTVVLDSAVTDASGNYAFANLQAGSPNYRIATTLPPYVAGSNTNIVVNNGAATTLNIYMLTFGKISGRVRKATDSTGIQNALVQLRRGGSDTSAVLDSARTDAQGAYTFANLAAANGFNNPYRVMATASGFTTASNTGVSVSNGATTTSNFFLGVPGSIAGKVRKASDSTTALANASVYLRRTSATSAIVDSAKTDAQGNYAFANVAFGTPNYYVTASLTGYVSATNGNVAVGSGAAVTSHVYLVLIVPGSITGKVRKASDSTQIAGARLKLRRGNSDTTAVLDSAVTDANGNYTFGNLTPLLTDYRVTASSAGLVSVTNANITVPNGGVATSNFYLAVPGSLAGKVRRLPDSLAFKGVLVVMRQGNGTSPILDSAKTDSLGNFAFANLTPATNYRITASFTGYTSVTNSNLIVTSSLVTSLNVFLSPLPRGKVYGRVRKATDSTSLKGALVVLRRGSDTAAVVDSARTDSTGRFVFASVLSGTPNYWLTATLNGFTLQTVSNVAIPANDSMAANFFLSAAVIALRPETPAGRAGFSAERLGNQWLIRMPMAEKPRAFQILDMRGALRYQAVVPAGMDRIYVPGDRMAPGALLRLH